MKQITVRYVGDLDFNGKLESIYQTYEKNYKTILFHIYSGVLDRELLLRVTGMIQSRFSTEQIIGSISAGEIKQGRLMDRGILVSAMMFEQSDVRVFRFPESVGKEKEVGRQIRELTDEIEDLKALELMFPGTNLNTRELFEEISKCPPEIQVFGGYAGGHATDSGEHYVFDHKDLYAHMIFLVAYAGKELHVTVDKSVGWQTLGMPFKVTKADGNRLIEVNHRPAVELYQKYMQIEVNEDFAQETFEFPLMAQIDGEEILRHTNSVEADGTLVLAGYVTQGMDIYLCYGAPSDIVNKVDVRLEEMYRFRPEAILLYSCSVLGGFCQYRNASVSGDRRDGRLSYLGRGESCKGKRRGIGIQYYPDVDWHAGRGKQGREEERWESEAAACRRFGAERTGCFDQTPDEAGVCDDH